MINDNEIGYNVNIILKGFNGNNDIPAKIDTGAEMSSLHANNVNVQSKTVEFDFGDRHVTMPLSGYQRIKTADGGTENRPVVKFTIEIEKDGTEKDVVLNNISFTLNDRSNMKDKVLLGLNFIEAGKFVISSVAAVPKDIVEIKSEDPNKLCESSRSEIINNIIELIEFNDVSLDELIKFKGK